MKTLDYFVNFTEGNVVFDSLEGIFKKKNKLGIINGGTNKRLIKNCLFLAKINTCDPKIKDLERNSSLLLGEIENKTKDFVESYVQNENYNMKKELKNLVAVLNQKALTKHIKASYASIFFTNEKAYALTIGDLKAAQFGIEGPNILCETEEHSYKELADIFRIKYSEGSYIYYPSPEISLGVEKIEDIDYKKEIMSLYDELFSNNELRIGLFSNEDLELMEKIKGELVEYYQNLGQIDILNNVDITHIIAKMIYLNKKNLAKDKIVSFSKEIIGTKEKPGLIKKRIEAPLIKEMDYQDYTTFILYSNSAEKIFKTKDIFFSFFNKGFYYSPPNETKQSILKDIRNKFENLKTTSEEGAFVYDLSYIAGHLKPRSCRKFFWFSLDDAIKRVDDKPTTLYDFIIILAKENNEFLDELGRFLGDLDYKKEGYEQNNFLGENLRILKETQAKDISSYVENSLKNKDLGAIVSFAQLLKKYEKDILSLIKTRRYKGVENKKEDESKKEEVTSPKKETVSETSLFTQEDNTLSCNPEEYNTLKEKCEASLKLIRKLQEEKKILEGIIETNKPIEKIKIGEKYLTVEQVENLIKRLEEENKNINNKLKNYKDTETNVEEVKRKTEENTIKDIISSINKLEIGSSGEIEGFAPNYVREALDGFIKKYDENKKVIIGDKHLSLNDLVEKVGDYEKRIKELESSNKELLDDNKRLNETIKNYKPLIIDGKEVPPEEIESYLNAKIEELSDKYIEKNNKIKELNKKIEQAEELLEKASKKTYEIDGKEYTPPQLVELVQNLKNEKGSLENKIEEYEEGETVPKSEYEKGINNIKNEFDKIISEKDSEISKLQKQLDTANSNIDNMKNTINNLENEKGSLEKKIEEYKSGETVPKSEYEELKKDYDNLTKDYDKLKEEYDKLKEEYDTLEKDYNKEDKKSLDWQAATLITGGLVAIGILLTSYFYNGKITKYNNSIEELTYQNKELKEEKEGLEKKKEELEKKKKELEEENKRLVSENEDLASKLETQGDATKTEEESPILFSDEMENVEDGKLIINKGDYIWKILDRFYEGKNYDKSTIEKQKAQFVLDLATENPDTNAAKRMVFKDGKWVEDDNVLPGNLIYPGDSLKIPAKYISG